MARGSHSHHRRLLQAALAVLCLLVGCDDRDNSMSSVEGPGSRPVARAHAPRAAAASLQQRKPVDALDVYVDGFHFYNGNPEGQVEAHHFCSAVDHDVRQCVIFDGNGRDAKLVGIEYIVSRRVFEQLPAEERKLWHSHVYEVKSGTLVAPGLPESAELEFMKAMVGTYGKTWHTWHTEDDRELPMGHPMLMAGFTADDQVDPDLIANRDQRLGIATSDERKSRSGIVAPDVVDGADAWQDGEVLQLTLQLAATGMPTHEQRAPARDDATGEPTRRLRGTRAHQLYAAVPNDLSH
jgi:hypothetical protein